MKKRILKIEKRFWLLLLFLTGIITGCSTQPSKSGETKDYDDTGATEYGCPHASYSLNIKITDQNSKEISGIEVAFVDSAENSFPIEITDSTGIANYSTMGFPDGKLVIVKIRDIDGKTNGQFRDMDTSIAFDPGDLVDENDDTWDQGEAFKELTIKLKKK